MRVNRASTPTEVLGQEFASELAHMRSRIASTASRYDSVVVNAWELMPTTIERLEEVARPDETWIFVRDRKSQTILAYESASERGQEHFAEAVIYPEMASRLWAWWITHIWRATQLAEETFFAVERWSLASSFVLSRALLEEVASLAFEAREISDAWASVKSISDVRSRPEMVRNFMHIPVLRAFRGNRLKGVSDKLKSVNILTMIDRLQKDVPLVPFRHWYDWLSEAAHPGYGAPTTFASVHLVHGSGALSRATYATVPMITEGESSGLVANTQTRLSGECLLACCDLLLDIAPAIESIVRDFDLTSNARSLTSTVYVRGLDESPKDATTIEHIWGRPAPIFSLRDHLTN